MQVCLPIRKLDSGSSVLLKCSFIVPVSHTITPDTPIADLDAKVIRRIDDRGPAFELKLLVRSPHVEHSHHPSTIHIPSDAKRYYAGYAFMKGVRGLCLWRVEFSRSSVTV